MTRRDDERLLDQLAVALAPPAAEPSAAEVEALHRAVAGYDDAVATVTVMPRRAVGWRLGLVAAAALVLMVALVANRPDSGVSTELARARTSMQALQVAVDRADRDAVAAALPEVERRLAALEPAEREDVEPEATRLEERARALLAIPTPTTTVVTTTTAPPQPARTPTTVDDKGGDRDRSGSNSGPG